MMTTSRSAAGPQTAPLAPRPDQPRDPAQPARPVSPTSASSGSATTAPVEVPSTASHRRVRRSRVGGIWIGIIVAAVVLVILLIFILQNTATVTIRFLGYSGGVPIAVALLLAAICGVLLVAIPGTVRILQLRRAVKKPFAMGPNAGP